MKKAFSIFIMLIVVLMASSCGKSETPVENKQTSAPVKKLIQKSLPGLALIGAVRKITVPIKSMLLLCGNRPKPC